MLQSLFDKVVDLQACNFIKKRLQPRFFLCKYSKIFKNTCFEEHLRTATSKRSLQLKFLFPPQYFFSFLGWLE